MKNAYVHKLSFSYTKNKFLIGHCAAIWQKNTYASSTLRRTNLKTQQLLVILDFCLRKTSERKMSSKMFFKMFFVSTNTKSRRFKIPLVWKAVFEKLLFRDGPGRWWGRILLCISVETEMRFQNSPAQCARLRPVSNTVLKSCRTKFNLARL